MSIWNSCACGVKHNDNEVHTVRFPVFKDMFTQSGTNIWIGEQQVFETDQRPNIIEASIINAEPQDTLVHPVMRFSRQAFNDCTSLERVMMKNVLTIPEATFTNCSSLTCVSADGCYAVADDLGGCSCGIDLVYSKYNIGIASEYAERGDYPIWKSELSDSSVVSVNVCGFDPESEQNVLPFAHFIDNTVVKSITVDGNVCISAGGVYQQEGGYLDYFCGAFGLSSVKFTQKLTPSMFYDPDEGAYAGGCFANKYDYQEVEPGQWECVSAVPYLSSLVIEFTNNTIDEILEIESLKDSTPAEYEGPYCIGSLGEAPQIKCGNTYYMLGYDYETKNVVVACSSDTKMNVKWDEENFYWYKAD